jgi:integrase
MPLVDASTSTALSHRWWNDGPSAAGTGELITFAAYTGLRAGELAALRWERVDLLRGSVDVAEAYAEVHGRLELGPTKTYSRRTVALPQLLVEMLAPRAKLTGLVFEAAEGGPIRQSNFYSRVFIPASVRAGAGTLRRQASPATCGTRSRAGGIRTHDLRSPRPTR